MGGLADTLGSVFFPLLPSSLPVETFLAGVEVLGAISFSGPCFFDWRRAVLCNSHPSILCEWGTVCFRPLRVSRSVEVSIVESRRPLEARLFSSGVAIDGASDFDFGSFTLSKGLLLALLEASSLPRIDIHTFLTCKTTLYISTTYLSKLCAKEQSHSYL